MIAHDRIRLIVYKTKNPLTGIFSLKKFVCFSVQHLVNYPVGIDVLFSPDMPERDRTEIRLEIPDLDEIILEILLLYFVFAVKLSFDKFAVENDRNVNGFGFSIAYQLL